MVINIAIAEVVLICTIFNLYIYFHPKKQERNGYGQWETQEGLPVLWDAKTQKKLYQSTDHLVFDSWMDYSNHQAMLNGAMIGVRPMQGMSKEPMVITDSGTSRGIFLPCKKSH